MTAGIVIVGAGECGGRAALCLRESGYRGPVTLIGAERHLPYERPPLSKVLSGPPTFITDKAALAAADIRHLASRTVDAIDRGRKNVAVTGGETIAFDKLLLATGARPRRINAAPHILYLRTYDDAVAIRARLQPGSRLLLIGAGFIGLELAASARTLGVEVTVVEAQPRVLMRGVPEEIALLIAERHPAAGVKILTGDLRPDYVSNVVVAGIGAVPNTDLAEAAGLVIDNGIAVDARLATSDADIFAAGDCCSFPLSVYGGKRVRLESWRNAGEQGALAARNMLGANEPVSSVPWFYSDQYELGLQIAGLADGATETIRRDLGKGAFILFHLAADGTMQAASGVGPGNAIARDIKFSERLIGNRARPAAAQLAASDVKLSSLL